jgi:L-asparaginase
MRSPSRFAVAIVIALLAQAALAADLPRIKILATGGTIAGTAAAATKTVGYQAAVLPIDNLLAGVPELKTIATVSGEQIAQIASENMTNEVWLKLAKRVNELLAQKDVDGIVITHGTDTMEETAYFLNLVVKSDKPVVLVGSMRPATAMSADGPLNIYDGVLVAASAEAQGKGVLVCLDETIHGARDVSKTHTSAVGTFREADFGALGYVQDGRVAFYKASTRKHTTRSEFDVSKLTELPRVEIVYGYANVSRAMLDAAVGAGAKGVIHAGVGNGSLFNEVKAGLVDARKKGVVIVRSSRTGAGIVARNGEANDDELDFAVSDSLNPQKARVLLMLALTRTTDSKQIQKFFYEY